MGDLGAVGFGVSASVLVNEYCPRKSSKTEADFYSCCEILAFLLLFHFQITNFWVVDCLLYKPFQHAVITLLHLTILYKDVNLV
jgi:hypothetical protein